MSFFMESCVHVFCEECLRKYFLSFGDETDDSLDFDELSILCPANGCCQTVPSQLISSVLSEKEYSKLLDMELRRALKNADTGNTFITCPNSSCKNIVERIHMKREEIISELESQKRPIKEDDIHKEEFRFRCRVCSLEFCSKCLKSPYHEGFTCDTFLEYLSSKRCRYCDSSIDINCNGDICENEECKQKALNSCNHKHTCGHHCCGIKDEFEHLPCLNCSSRDTCQSGDDYCNICWISSLNHAPCIQLNCGHIFHFECIKKKLEKKWHGARVSFSFEKCPLCNTSIHHPALKDETTQVRALKSIIEKKSLVKLEQEGLLKIEEITSPSGKYYNKPLEYAMNSFSFYMCHECKSPYYGGKIQCGEQNEDDNFNPEELVCGSCCAKKVRQEGVCEVHGAEFISYKCKFCW
ncbi:predicted protein [Naegleria gruberi]|uniref:RCR-type E3 ubiquitin transferase n=1 Tax=Naegleria gruberi TaxID=5762 RepID=D2UXL3_NAEGR|nr:uncharacterized protein NAEGRDRAFT_61166 [Naegleria gruberi]EFC50655.1 predicted protein [Naegleria gruberi]|eukprot:XP_002683399.1 predicted protein [Naegleria gruberi strain NEG-M]